MKRILATTAIVALTAVPGFAQTQSSDDAQVQQSDSTQMSAEMMGEGDVSAERDGMVVHASNLIGQPVYIRGENAADAEIADSVSEPSEDWERIGEVGDVIISKDGQIDSVMLDAGGFLGMGEKHVRTSMDELKFVGYDDGGMQDDTASDEQAATDGAMQEGEFFVVFTGDRSQIEEREQVDEQTVRDEGGSFFQDDGMNRTAGQDMEDGSDQDMAQSDEGMAEQSDQDTAQTDDTQMSDQTDQDMAQTDGQMADEDMQAAELTSDERNVLTAEELEGLSVYGTSDEQIGEISELVLANDGKITDRLAADSCQAVDHLGDTAVRLKQHSRIGWV